MRALVFGGAGYLGNQMCRMLGNCIIPRVDIADASIVAKWMRFKPDVVINAAGKTGRPNVDWCEDNKVATFRSNVTGAAVLLQECLERGIYFVHIGSGCIYSGDKAYTEEDAPNFDGSFYSHTKLLADRMMSRHDVLNLRLRMPFEPIPGERNLLTKLVGYDRVLDVPNSMTYVPDFLNAANALISQRVTGTFNVVNPYPMSPYKVARWLGHDCDPISEAELCQMTKAPRSSCVLNGDKLAQFYQMRPTVDALQECV